MSTAEAIELLGLSRAADLAAAARARHIKPVRHKVGMTFVHYWRVNDIKKIKADYRPRAPKVRPTGFELTVPEYANMVGVSRQRIHAIIALLVEKGAMKEPTLIKGLRWLTHQNVRVLDKYRGED